jgi:hypothetical protein
MNAVFGAARQATGAVDTPSEVAHPPPAPLPPQRIRDRFAGGIVNSESVKGKRLDQIRDGRAAVQCQMPGEDVAQFDSSQVFHRRTVAHRSDMKPKFAQRRAIRHLVRLSFIRGLRVVPAALGGDAGLIGAAALVSSVG